MRRPIALLALTQGAIALLALAALLDFRPSPVIAALVLSLVCAAGAWLLFRVHRSAAALAGEVEARKRAEQEARAASLAKDQLLANASHEIRTPMNGVLGMAELVLRAELPVAQREQVELIRTSAEALLALVGDILDLSKIETGHLELRPIDFRLRKLLSEVVRLLAPQAGAKGIELRLDAASEVPDDLYGDPVRLRQVVLNLVSNAIRHTREGFVAVTVEVRQREADVARLRCEVRDTGMGIRQEIQARLFQPFARSGSATALDLGGTGLGLVISKNVVELMGGEIGFESARGVGSTFWFEVPLVAARGAAVAPFREAFNRRENDRRAARHRCRVLVVDDHSVNRILALAQLRDLGYVAEAAENGRAALDLLSRSAYSAVLLDCGMPEIDGYETCRRLREREGEDRHTPVIALTAFTMAGEREKCLAAGMDDYLAKPYRREDLAAVLDRWLEIAARAATPAALEADGFDQRLAALERLGQETGQETLTEVVETFLARGAADLEAMHGALARGDGEAAADAAHALCGSSGILGAAALATACAELEGSAREGDLDACTARLAAVEQEYQTISKRLAP